MPTILIVDDDFSNATLLEGLLQARGYATMTAANGPQGLSLAASQPVDLILLDVMMPGMDGFEVCGRLKAEPKTRRIPVVMVTALIDHETRLRALEHGADEFLTKPVDRAELWARAKNLLDVKAYWDFLAGENETLEALVKQRTAELLQAQKLEAMGRLAGGVAHDFNNLLQVVLGMGELALGELPPGERPAQNVSQMVQAAERAANLTRQLLAFSRQQVVEPRVVDLNPVVTGIAKMLRRLIGEDVELTARLDPELGRVRADPGQLEQVLMNLAVNSRDAMPRGGKLTIETANAEVDDVHASQHPPLAPGSYVVLAVTDTGTGMDAETKSRVFDPFFTTKEAGKGTGLGLSTVHGIVTQAGGHVAVCSEVSRGTTFRLYLPRIAQQGEAAAEPAEPPSALTGTETLLLVEDDPNVRSTLRRVLEGAGYVVLEAEDGRQALDVAAVGQGVDLILTDVVLSTLSGPEVAARLAVRRPWPRVLFMSGYTDDAVFRHGMLEPGMAFLQKPFSRTTLLRKAREVLENRGAHRTDRTAAA